MTDQVHASKAALTRVEKVPYMKTPRIRRPRLTYANVASTFALLLATSMGGAYAHGMIGSSEIQNNAVKSRHIGAGQVKTPDLAASAVKTAKIANNAVNGAKVADRSLSGNDLAPRSTGMALAGLSKAVGASTTVTNQFNRLGGAITVTRPSAGRFNVTIPGATFSSGWDKYIVSITGTYNAVCYMNSTVNTTTIQVACRTWTTDVDTDGTFQLLLFKDVAGMTPRGASRSGSATD